ncbi:MAG: peptidase M15 [bacterium]
MKKIASVKSLGKLGRVRLSRSFFMRDFLYSEVSQIENIPNIPDDPDVAIAAGRNLCEQVLEPIREGLGRISIRSAYRSCAVNAKCAQNNHGCARNEANYARHIWDRKDKNGFIGATACIVVNSFIPHYDRTGDWTALAWWIHDHVPAYAAMQFFPVYAAFNITWSADRDHPKTIFSWAKHPDLRGRYLTKPGWHNFTGDHAGCYRDYLRELSRSKRG